MVVTIVATLSPAPGKVERVAQLFEELCEYCEKHEPNTIRYVVSRVKGTGVSGDIPVKEGDAQFTIIEQYTDEASFNAHTKAEQQGFVGKALATENLLAKPLDIMRVDMLSGFESR